MWLPLDEKKKSARDNNCNNKKELGRWISAKHLLFTHTACR